MQNLLSKKVLFKSKLSDCRIAVQDLGATDGGAVGHRFCIKELQRRAFERGVSVERAKYSKMLGEMLELVKLQSQNLQHGIDTDRERIEGFAVNLSIQIAEKLTCAVVDQEQHNVVNMVKELLLELDSGTKSHGLVLRLNPGDHTALLDAAANTEIDLNGVELVPDAQIPVASPQLSGGDTHYYADLNERLAEIRTALMEEATYGNS